MNSCSCKERIEMTRAEMIRVFDTCHNFTDNAVVKVSQELDLLLLDYAYCTSKNQHLNPYSSSQTSSISF